MYSEPGQIGLSYEYYKYNSRSTNKAFIANLSYGVMNYDADIVDVDGTGFVIELGGRKYFNTSQKGLYSANYLSYGNIKFDKDTPFGNFDGTYSYFSFFAPEIGYKIKLGGISIDPYIGGMWKIEVKGKGDVDNNNTDEWVLRGGLRVGYSF
ncbi:autotransporter outer membrane beta-barrel domain-containing protein [Flavobacterium sp. AG291]|uniref:autotransporter outer membrane beta-barrel domain-containing protein n=1 Tax=Flavobacterium sp. AG291 TaxID=2184000 RepID=UPI0011C077DA|nr:autotransporter outer membrane beta-barrel domain-containing protein [Flavobacterium sp. AG291]